MTAAIPEGETAALPGADAKAAQRAAVARAMDRLFRIEGVTVRSAYTDISGIRIHHIEAGSGSTVLLLHGAGGGAANWYRMIAPLAARYHVVAPDLPGFGLSDGIPLRPPLGRYGAEFVAAWMDAVGLDRAAVIGTSFGGLLALRLAQRDASRIDKLVLIDSAGLGAEMPWLARLATLPGVGRFALRPSREGTRMLFRLLLTSDRTGLRGHEDALIEYLYASAAAGDPVELSRALRLFGGLRGQREILSPQELSALMLPTLVVWGANDRFLPVTHALSVVSRLPDARSCVIPRAGHSPNWETPDAVSSAVLPFLANSETAPNAAQVDGTAKCPQ